MTDFISDSVNLLRDMVRIPSESFGEEQVCSLICERLSQWGIRFRRVGCNILAFNERFDSSKPSLALDAHIDTVPAAASYTRDPLDPGDDPDVVYGLGSNDDGGSVVAMIAALRQLDAEGFPGNVVLVLSSEEERSGPDGARLVYGPEGSEEAASVRWVIVGEPTGMKAATSERGLLVLDGEAVGVSGHAARNEGVNALYIALDDIAALRSHEFIRVSPSMGKVMLNVTQIEAGTAHNVIPDSCRFVVDIRPTEQYTGEEILSELQGLCRSRLTPRNLSNRSSATRQGSPLEKTALQMGIETFSSPTTSNWMRTGRDSIKMGPGDSARSHRADEYIFVKEINEGAEKYVKFVKLFYGNTLE